MKHLLIFPLVLFFLVGSLMAVAYLFDPVGFYIDVESVLRQSINPPTPTKGEYTI
jgi:hypothetical protein